MTRVVEKLILGCAPVDVVVIFGAAIEDTRVATRAQLPIEGQFEVSEPVLRQEVTNRPCLGQRAMDDLPAGGQCGLLITSPGRGAGSVEERPPTACPLLGGQRGGSCTGAIRS